MVSYLEWVQSLNGLYWEEEQIKAELERKLVKAFEEAWGGIHKKGFPSMCGLFNSHWKNHRSLSLP